MSLQLNKKCNWINKAAKLELDFGVIERIQVCSFAVKSERISERQQKRDRFPASFLGLTFSTIDINWCSTIDLIGCKKII